jgi:hypothetical protein
MGGGFGILTNLSPTRFESQRIWRNRERDKLGLNERLNGYELGLGSGLNPNRWDARFLGWIPANGLVERVHSWQPDRSTVTGALGLG